MGRYRFFSAGRVACVLGFCAGAFSACLNPIPDDFPNQDDRHFDPDPGAPDSESQGAGGGASGPIVTSPDSPAEVPLGGVDSEAPPASDPLDAPDAGAGDAGSAEGTVGGR